jgi:TM2 domain-containing membrane protein YozV
MATHSAFIGYLLWLLLGIFGVHRFYFGKRTTGVLYALTAGFAGVGWLVDLFLIPRMKGQVSGRYQYGRYNYAIGWLLLVVLGVFGAHQFYVGRWKKGLLYLCTLGLLGFGVIYDIFTFNDTLSERNEQWISGEAAYLA